MHHTLPAHFATGKNLIKLLAEPGQGHVVYGVSEDCRREETKKIV